MIISAKEALYYALTHDETLTSLLGAGDRVFGAWPENLEILPCVTFFFYDSDPDATDDRFKTIFQIDVWATLHSTLADSIAERIWAILHKKTISINGTVKSFCCFVSSPMREGFAKNVRYTSFDVTVCTQN